ncbi:hypothetical protein [Haladaptatus sp. NG-WS-4]
MSNLSASSVLRPKRPLVVGAVLVTVLVTLWLFVPTMQGHIAIMNVGSVDVTATEFAVTDGGEHLSVTFDVHNPTGREILFTGSVLHAYAGQTQLNDGTTTMFETTTIPPRETAQITADIDLEPGQQSRAKRAAEDGAISIRGELNGEIGRERVDVPVRIERGDA